MSNCLICERFCKSLVSLAKHIHYNHSEIGIKKYYDLYLKSNQNEGSCMICGNNTEFITLRKGYHKTCSHTCGGIFHRDNLNQNEEKSKIFKNKLSINQEKIWQDRKKNGEAQEIINKMRETSIKTRSLMTVDERKKKFGWLNNVSDAIKQELIENKIIVNGCHSWWKTASEEQKQELYDRRAATMLGMSLECYKEYKLTRSEEQKYRQKVKQLTEKTYKKYKHIIDPENKRGANYHLDHKFSVLQGFLENVSPDIISSLHNLEILEQNMNTSKSNKCSITRKELEESYYNGMVSGQISAKKS